VAVGVHHVVVWVCVSAFIPSPFRGGRTPLLEADGNGARLINHERTQKDHKDQRTNFLISKTDKQAVATSFFAFFCVLLSVFCEGISVDIPSRKCEIGRRQGDL
jgi:hypothetical protein